MADPTYATKPVWALPAEVPSDPGAQDTETPTAAGNEIANTATGDIRSSRAMAGAVHEFRAIPEGFYIIGSLRNAVSHEHAYSATGSTTSRGSVKNKYGNDTNEVIVIQGLDSAAQAPPDSKVPSLTQHKINPPVDPIKDAADRTGRIGYSQPPGHAVGAVAEASKLSFAVRGPFYRCFPL